MFTFLIKSAVIVGTVGLLAGCGEIVTPINDTVVPSPIVPSPTIITTQPVAKNVTNVPTATAVAMPMTSVPPAMQLAAVPLMETEQLTVPMYQNYTPGLYTSLKGKKPFVLFFHAPWCHICKRMEQEIKSDLANFPLGTVILKTDYDTEVALKKTWKIQLQSTIVVLDANGDSIFKGTDPSITEIKEHITQSLK